MRDRPDNPGNFPGSAIDDTNYYGNGFFNLTRCQRSFAFYRMFPVVFNIPVIINNINSWMQKNKKQ